MSSRANRLRHSHPHDDGYVLPTVIIVLTVGAMVAIALLGYAAALLKAGGDDADSVLHLYAADAGITAMKQQLERGIDTAPDPFMFDGIIVNVGITPIPTPRAPLPTLTPHPIVPGWIQSEEGQYEVTIKSVPPGTELKIRWYAPLPTPSLTATSTPTVPPSIEGYVSSMSVGDGTPTPTPIVTSVPCSDSQWVCVEKKSLDLPGEKDIEFIFNPGSSDVSPHRFRGRCQDRDEPSFCLTAAPTDYVVVSTTGTDNRAVTAYIRRFPQWTRIGDLGDPRYEVTILSWKPYKPEDMPEDAQAQPTATPEK